MEKSIIQINQEQLKEILAKAEKPIHTENGPKTIIESVDNIVLKFGRTEVDSSTSSVEFTFKEVKLLTPKHFVIEGEANISRCPLPKKMLIDYMFGTQQFYEAICCANGTVRHMKLLCLDYAGAIGKDNVEAAVRLIRYMITCLAKGENPENNKEEYSAASSDEIFDLNKIPMEVLDKGYVSYRKYCSPIEENLNNK